MSTFTNAQIDAMSGPELVKAHNALSAKKVKRFASRGAGVKRVKALVAGGAKPKATPAPAKASKAPAKKSKKAKTTKAPAKKPAAGKTGVARRKPFNYPVTGEEIKGHRDGTKRAKVIAAMSRAGGATIEEMMKATGWNYATCYRGIFMVHYDLGYGIKEDAKGRIRLVG